MPTLHLGVIDIPYQAAPTKRGKKSAATVTTGDVAEILESEYHVMQHFFELHQADIAKSLEESMEGALETLLMGGKVSTDLSTVMASASSEIDDMFKNMISNKELDGLGYPGIPTQASLMGVDHRKKNPYKRRPPRPSFKDTGLYLASFRSWFET
jgi:hypothetical protein